MLSYVSQIYIATKGANIRSMNWPNKIQDRIHAFDLSKILSTVHFYPAVHIFACAFSIQNYLSQLTDKCQHTNDIVACNVIRIGLLNAI